MSKDFCKSNWEFHTCAARQCSTDRRVICRQQRLVVIGQLRGESSRLCSQRERWSIRGFNGDVLFHGNLGVQAEINWKASQGNYIGLAGYRPLFYDVNAIYAKRFSKQVGAEVLGGIGAESIRFYTGQSSCDFHGNCTNDTSSNQ